MNIADAKNLVCEFMRMRTMDILDRFADTSKESIVIKTKPTGRQSSCFIPGTRKDKVLLIAHVDTVWEDPAEINPCLVENTNVLISGDLFKSGHNAVGIGADDRAGIAILWELRNLGHSLLLVNGEERGGLGSHFIMDHKEKWRRKAIQDHQFAIQFDRRGSNDLVFYDVGTPEFVKYCEKSTGFKMAHGTFTDICILCRKICGVNMSVGYENEHMAFENLNLDHWNRTLETAREWMSRKDIPKFPR